MTLKNSDYQSFWDKLCDWLSEELEDDNFKYSEQDSQTHPGPITHQPISSIPQSLSNTRANCYLNSALQGISSCNKFVTDITIEYRNNKDLKKLEIFYKLLHILNGGKENRLEISHCPIFREWNKSGQQDSFELLAYVINQVYNEIRTNKENKGEIPKRDMEEWLKIQLPMRILIKYTIKCGCSNEVNVPLQSDIALHVSIPSTGKNELQTLVDQYFLEDYVQNFHCDKKGCNGEKAMKYTRLCKPLPRTLCIHLQRTFWNGKKMVKINTMIPFTKTLKIKNQFCLLKNINIKEDQSKTSSVTATETIEHSTDESIPQDETVSNSNNKHCNNFIPNVSTQVEDSNTDNENNNLQSKELTVDVETLSNLNENADKSVEISYELYILTSVIVHSGSINSGHYICYKWHNDKWFLTDDSRITQVQENTVLNSKAYVLFYEKD